MPTYEYRCDACSHEFEQFQSITATPLRKCPKCGKSKLKRLIGAGAGVIFKGSGFYETDYRSASYKAAAKADTAGSSSGKSDTAKPAETAKSDSPSSSTTSTASDKGSSASSNGKSTPAAKK